MGPMGELRSTLGLKSPIGDPPRQESLSESANVRDEEAMLYLYDEGSSLKPVYDMTSRRLKARHVELIGMEGYVQHDA